MQTHVLAAALVGVGTVAPVAAQVYVDDSNNSGVEDGTSWGTAYRTPQQALDYVAATPGALPPFEIRIAEGRYVPTAPAGPAREMTLSVGPALARPGPSSAPGWAPRIRPTRPWATPSAPS